MDVLYCLEYLSLLLSHQTRSLDVTSSLSKDHELKQFIDEVTNGAVYNLSCLEVTLKLVKKMEACGDERIKKIEAGLVTHHTRGCSFRILFWRTQGCNLDHGLWVSQVRNRNRRGTDSWSLLEEVVIRISNAKWVSTTCFFDTVGPETCRLCQTTRPSRSEWGRTSNPWLPGQSNRSREWPFSSGWGLKKDSGLSSTVSVTVGVEELGFVQTSPTTLFEDINDTIPLVNSVHFKKIVPSTLISNPFPLWLCFGLVKLKILGISNYWCWNDTVTKTFDGTSVESSYFMWWGSSFIFSITVKVVNLSSSVTNCIHCYIVMMYCHLFLSITIFMKLLRDTMM